MPESSEHSVVGGIIGLLCYLAHTNLTKTKPSLGGAIGSTLLGSVTGILPDIIEPPIDPNHRGLFHSKSLGIFLTSGLKGIADSKISRDSKLISAILGLSYLSHLAMDSQTSKGIPVL